MNLYFHLTYKGYYFKYIKNLKKGNYSQTNIYLNEADEVERLDQHFIRKTMQQISSIEQKPLFNRTIMIIIHQFADTTRRDLDNACYKPVIDAIRKCGLIIDDSHFHLSLILFGKVGNEEEINVILINHYDIDNLAELIKKFI